MKLFDPSAVAERGNSIPNLRSPNVLDCYENRTELVYPMEILDKKNVGGDTNDHSVGSLSILVP